MSEDNIRSAATIDPRISAKLTGVLENLPDSPDDLLLAALGERIPWRKMTPAALGAAIMALREAGPEVAAAVDAWIEDEHRSVCACCRARHEASDEAASAEAVQ